MFQTKPTEEIKAHILCSIPCFENNAFCEIMWKNMVENGRSQTTMWRMRIAWLTIKATNTHTEYVIFITFSLQEWLHERPLMLRDTYIACVAMIVLSPHFKQHNLLIEM